MPDTEPRHFHHPLPNPAWLALHAEPILDPDLPIIDPHHHLWDHPGNPYLLDDLLADTASGHRILATVFVQCGWAHRAAGPEALRPVGETEAVVAVAEQAERRGIITRLCAGIVGHADLALGAAVAPVLEAHIAAGRGRFRGIRHVTARHEDFVASIAVRPQAGLMASAAFRAGFAQLARCGLSFDAWLYHEQLAELAALAAVVPEVPIVINHIGGAVGIGPWEGRRAEVFAGWRAAMRRLAEQPQVSVKLGGLGMRVAGFEFHLRPVPPSSTELAAAWRPWIDACIEDFGVARCMFESNFPVDKAMVAYPVLWNAFKRLAQGASAEERALLFAGTASRFYRLDR